MRLPLLLLLTLRLAVRTAAAPEYAASPGPFTVVTLEQIWHDSNRDRDVPVKIYFPKTTGEYERSTSPIIIFSHGLGGSREGYGYLGEHWASYGYISVHLQHLGSDREVLRSLRPLKAMQKAAADPAAAINRPLDVSFAIDRLTALDVDQGFPLHGRMDLTQIGVAGHSYGAFTAMGIAGARIPVLGSEPRYRDPRVKAAIAMSTPSTAGNQQETTFDAVQIAVFHLTGTKDGSDRNGLGGGGDAIVGNTKPGERLLPYEHTRHAPAYLLVFEGGDHMVFSGRLGAKRATDPIFQDHILTSSTAFWDAWLRHDLAAKAWLEDGAFARKLGPLGDFKHKSPGQP
ncbi:MAG: dienelactone hydrolase [Opitutae bacterium]